MYHRSIKLPQSHAFFLFGARGTGKTSLLENIFSKKNSVWIDLLNPELADQLMAYPNRLLDIILAEKDHKPWVVIDEIQKIPKLLDLVHQQIHMKNFHFALTGSSSRKLKRGSANLLAGRAFIFTLFPLTVTELDNDFNLDIALQFGTLPEIWNLTDTLERKRFLKSYALTFIKEEIVAEQLIRNLPPFRRFLEVAALSNTEVISYSNIAKDIQSDPKTVSNYYQILEDTLLGIILPSFHTSIRKRQKSAPKFYFFDTGVARTLAGHIDHDLIPKSFEYGRTFESFIINEIHRQLTYLEKDFRLSYIRVDDHQEIDLVIERSGQPLIFCEIKSTNHVDERHCIHLENLSRNLKNIKQLVISKDPVKKKIRNSIALPWPLAIHAIVNDDL